MDGICELRNSTINEEIMCNCSLLFISLKNLVLHPNLHFTKKLNVKRSLTYKLIPIVCLVLYKVRCKMYHKMHTKFHMP